MSIKFSLLALLDAGPMYGAQLRHEFEQRTGGTWPLNVGQVYTTLSRLERDGLVETTGDADDEGRIAYRLTESGRAEVSRWWDVPVGRDQAQRNELAIKLALAVTLPGVDVQRIVQAQRTATMTHLRDLTRLKRSEDDADLAWALVLESLVFADEAEVRWLDHVESKLAQVRPKQARSNGAGRAAYSRVESASRETSRK